MSKEQGMSNHERVQQTSKFKIPCSIFIIQSLPSAFRCHGGTENTEAGAKENNYAIVFQ
jgi:hypothetical protein